MIALVDYGLGNIGAFVKIYQTLGIQVAIARTCDDLQNASRIILPGVGSFDWAMTRLNQSGLRAALDDIVLIQRKPVLGVCVGMQMMARSSEEGSLSGLGWVDADVVKLTGSDLQLPHMGWNVVSLSKDDGLFYGIDCGPFYFLHSYYVRLFRDEDVLTTSYYGLNFSSAFSVGNIYGTQFHPEKSHQSGVRLLKNFAELC